MTTVTASQQLPHNYEDIVKDADLLINNSVEHVFGHLCDGILLNQKTKRYWIDKKSNNCFLVYARALKLVHDNKTYWQWPSLEETSNVFIDAAELLNVCWLDVRGVFDSTANLSPGIMYEVAFVVMLKASGSGWEIPVTVEVTLPDGKEKTRRVNLMEKARGQWIEIPVGEFKASREEVGNIKFLMAQYGGHWKNGLVIKGVAVQPKKERERRMNLF